MPFTVNGIGTHYYGQKNHFVSTEVCGSCGRVGNLVSYDTRLWFVVVFIPVIPLGRKRIINQCPSCTRHHAIKAADYEQAVQRQAEARVEEFHREPSPASALMAHGGLLFARDHEQAATFRQTAVPRFADRADFLLALASQLREVSLFDEAAPLEESALRVQPDLPQARVAVARVRMRQGDPDEARRLLDFLERPAARQAHSLAPLEELALCYQRQGRHHEALDLAGLLLREYPQVGQNAGFRALVRRSETSLHAVESILPARGHRIRGLFWAKDSPYPAWQRRLATGSALLGLLTAGLWISNEIIRRHRTLHVLNACGQPVEVRVDDGPPTTVGPGMGEVAVAEGPHRVRLGGPVNETHDVNVESAFLDRWTNHPVWVLNPGGEAVLQQMTLYYAKNPRDPDRRVIVGSAFSAFPHVDYPFQTPPQRLSVKGNTNTERVKTTVAWVQGQDADAFREAVAADREQALGFAERRLRRGPDQDELLRAYLEQTLETAPSRVEAFLKSGLGHRPVVVGWHRAYQTVAELNRHESELLETYTRALAAEPGNGALLYLRGRIEPDWDRQEELFRKSIDADATLAWPWMARGLRELAATHWAESLRCLRKAQELHLEDDYLRKPMHVVRLTTGDAEGLIKDARGRLAANPLDATTMVFLCDALAASGKAESIGPELATWLTRLPGPIQSQIAPTAQAYAAYQQGKPDECEQTALQVPTAQGRVLRIQALLALGRAREVAADTSLEQAWVEPWLILGVSLGLALEGQAAEADRWRERACARLDAQTPESRKLAAVLRAAEPTALADLAHIHADVEDRALLLAVLAQQFPSRRAEYRAAAASFNVMRLPPYLLVRRAIETAPESAAAR